jgi:hypothetical protein
MTRTAFAKALGISRERLYQLIAMGMPITTVDEIGGWPSRAHQFPGDVDGCHGASAGCPVCMEWILPQRCGLQAGMTACAF